MGGDRSPDELLQPFFAAPASPVPVKRRMLLVFMDFASGSAVGPLRWKRLGELAAERGWQIDVVTQHPDFEPGADLSRLIDIAAGMRLYGFRAPPSVLQQVNAKAWSVVRPIFWRFLRQNRGRAGGGQRIVSRGYGGALVGHPMLMPLRGYATLVDWLEARHVARVAAELGVALTRKTRYDVVVSSGPSHTAHEAARLIAERARLPLVIDLRDAWVRRRLVVRRELDPPIWRRISEPIERRCFNAARLIVVTTDALRHALTADYPDLAERFITVRNGADREPLSKSLQARRFVIGYAGNLYAGRDPRLLFRAAQRVVATHSPTPAEFAIEFMGGDTIEGISVGDIAMEEGVGEFFHSYPPRSHVDALDFLASAAMLVVLPQYDVFAIPAKVYEYTQFNAWVLALAERHSATAALLQGSAADVVDPTDVDRISQTISRRYAEWRAGTRPLALNAGGHFDRRRQAEQLFTALDSCLRDA